MTPSFQLMEKYGIEIIQNLLYICIYSLHIGLFTLIDYANGQELPSTIKKYLSHLEFTY